MTWFYKNGFYCDKINPSIPEGAIEVSSELHLSLLKDQSEGKEIVVEDGKVIARARVVTDEIMETFVIQERNQKLASTDYLLMMDYPLKTADKNAVKKYRQALRDLPTKEGFPWTGKDVPWPVPPSIADKGNEEVEEENE